MNSKYGELRMQSSHATVIPRVAHQSQQHGPWHQASCSIISRASILARVFNFKYGEGVGETFTVLTVKERS